MGGFGYCGFVIWFGDCGFVCLIVGWELAACLGGLVFGGWFVCRVWCWCFLLFGFCCILGVYCACGCS